jgi:hypothetical protein
MTKYTEDKTNTYSFLERNSNRRSPVWATYIIRSASEVVWIYFKHVVKKKSFSSPATRHGGAWGERRYSSYSFTTSALDGGEWSASRPVRAFTPGERTPGTLCTGGWVGPRAGLDAEARGKSSRLCRVSNPYRPVVQPVVRHYTAWANPAPTYIL